MPRRGHVATSDGGAQGATVPPGDLSLVHGQEAAKRALEVALAGGHHALFIGPPGAGKSMLGRCIPGLLPPLTPAEAEEVAAVYHLARLQAPPGRPVRAPRPDGGQARSALLSAPLGLSLTRDGGLLIADQGTCRVRKVATDGTIQTVAGTVCGDGSAGTGDGGPATAAVFGDPVKAVEGPDGSIYVADLSGGRVRRIDAKGIVTTVAGDGRWGCSGSELAFPHDLAVDGAGNVWIANSGLYVTADPHDRCDSVMELTPDGTLTRVVPFVFPNGDGNYISPQGVAAGPDGSLYFTVLDAVVQVPPGGLGDDRNWILTGINRLYGAPGDQPFAGDGLPASFAATRFYAPTHVAVAADGTVYVTDRLNRRLRRIGPTRMVSTIAGGGLFIPRGDGLAATDAALQVPAGVAVDPGGKVVYFSDPSLHQVWKWRPPHPTGTDERAVPSEDGAVRYIFDSDGHHLRTEDAVTKQVLLSFTYADFAQGSGAVRHLATRITDAFGNATTINRGSDGTAQAIVSPFGQSTSVEMDGNGYLSQVARNGETVRLTMDEKGLLRSLTDPRSGTYTYDYDDEGRLTQAADPAGGSLGLTLEARDHGLAVHQVTAMGRTSAVEVELPADGPDEAPSSLAPGEQLVQTTTDSAGLKTQVRQSKDGSLRVLYPDGTTVATESVPDDRLGALASYDKAVTTTLPSGLSEEVSTSRSESPTDPEEPAGNWSETSVVNGRTFLSEYSSGTQEVTSTSAELRQTVTQLDGLGRPVQESIDGLFPVAYGYDGHGHLASLSQGGRTTTYTYGGDGYLASVQDPLGRVLQYQHDLVGRVTKETLPDGREVNLTYDANGNLASLTPPSRPAHGFSYDPVDEITSYMPPAVPGSGATSFAYNADHQLTSVTRPDGQAMVLDYDSAGRLSTVTTPTGAATYAYDASGNVASITAPGGGAVSYAYDGPLTTRISASGAVSGTVDVTYDRSADGSSNLWPTSETLNGDAAGTVAFSYDDDGLLTQAGNLALFHDGDNGLLTGTQLFTTGDVYERNGFGEVTRYQAGFDDHTCTPSGLPSTGCVTVLDQTFTRDAAGRITRKSETLLDPIARDIETHVHDYAYDLAGRLMTVERDGVVWESYGYDANSNRTSWTDPWGSGTATYDAQDRLLTYGSYSFTYTANGELKTKSQGEATVTYAYDVLGNLRSVTLADGIQIDYIIDALNRRTGKKVNGVLVKGFLYGGGAQPLAELDGMGRIVSAFVYGSHATVPDALMKDGVTYRIVTDHLGSVRWVLNAKTGEVMQRLDYDAFGRVLLDTNPGFQPFGFAGGLYDYQTGLVRFGARDYDAETGRWTAKDPIGFGGGETSLYTYVDNDAVNAIDSSGLETGFITNFSEWRGSSPPITKPEMYFWGGLFAVAAAPAAIPYVAAAAGTCITFLPTCNQLAIDVLDPVPGGSGPTSLGNGEAVSAYEGAQLRAHLRQLERYGESGFRQLKNGRFRYYGLLRMARRAGEMLGARTVREWDPATGATRTWIETLDNAGRIRSVRPEIGGLKIHHIFDAEGRYVGPR